MRHTGCSSTRRGARRDHLKMMIEAVAFTADASQHGASRRNTLPLTTATTLVAAATEQNAGFGALPRSPARESGGAGVPCEALFSSCRGGERIRDALRFHLFCRLRWRANHSLCERRRYLWWATSQIKVRAQYAPFLSYLAPFSAAFPRDTILLYQARIFSFSFSFLSLSVLILSRDLCRCSFQKVFY